MNGLVLAICLSDTSKTLAKDVSTTPFLSTNVAGQLFKKKFVPNVVEINKVGIQSVKSNGIKDQSMQWTLKFRTGKNFSPDQEIAVWISIDVNDKFDGLSFMEKPHRFIDDSTSDFTWKGKSRNVGMGFTAMFLAEKDRTGGDNIFSDRFSARVSFGKLVGNKIPGKIVLALPDGKGHLNGSFTAVFVK